MKKILTAFFLSVALMFAGLLCLNVNAATQTVDTLTASMFKATGTTYTVFKDVSVTNGSGAVYAGQSAMSDAGSIQLRSKNSNSGIVSTTSGGYVRKISITWDFSTTSGRTLDIYGNNSAYTSSSNLYDNNNKGTKIGSIVYGTSTELEITDDYAYVGLRSNYGAIYIKEIKITWEEATETTTYNINFNANGGTFAEGKGTAIENIENGTATTVTLPTSADLTKTLYETETKYTTLKSWTDGTNTYAPGEVVTVSSATTFTAVYEATDAVQSVINVEEALKICQLTGTNNTLYQFKVFGKIKLIETVYNETHNDISVVVTDGTNSLLLYRLSGGADLTVGAEIIATGYLKNFKGNTPEMDAKGTYTMVSKVECANFIETDTKSSLIVTYDEELKPTDVDLRLGGVITTDSYLAGATYGVLVTTGTVDLTAGKTAYATVAEFIAANEGFKNVTCTPAQVETGYQFAWVITDMEGNYNTSLTAVMYMVYDGALYICKSKTTSVKDTASQYIEDAGTLGLTEEQKNVLGKLVAYYGGNNNE